MQIIKKKKEKTNKQGERVCPGTVALDNGVVLEGGGGCACVRVCVCLCVGGE